MATSKKYESYKIHPAADSLPLIEGEDFDLLVADIRDNGLQDPIVVHESLIVDGRNRLRACIASGVKPRFVQLKNVQHFSEAMIAEGHEFEPDPVSYIESTNVHRRHLKAESKAMFFVMSKDIYSKDKAQKRVKEGAKQGGIIGGRGKNSPLTFSQGAINGTSRRETLRKEASVSSAAANNVLKIRDAFEDGLIEKSEIDKAIKGGSKALKELAKEVKEKIKAMTPPKEKPEPPKAAKKKTTMAMVLDELKKMDKADQLFISSWLRVTQQSTPEQIKRYSAITSKVNANNLDGFLKQLKTIIK